MDYIARQKAKRAYQLQVARDQRTGLDGKGFGALARHLSNTLNDTQNQDSKSTALTNCQSSNQLVNLKVKPSAFERKAAF